MSVKATTTVSTSLFSTCLARCSLVSTEALAPWCVPTSGAGDEALEQLARPGQVGGELLGMALHRNDKAVIRLHALDRAVLALRRLVQAGGETADGLVVEAVDPDLVLAGGVAQLGRRVDLDGVGEVAPPMVTDVVILEVLDERSAERDVDHLLAAADAQHRQLLVAGLAEQPELGLVEVTVDGAYLLVFLLAVEGRVDIPAARQQEPIHLGQLGRAGRELDGLRARRLDRLQVWDVVLLASPGADGDRDPGPFGH